MCSYCVNCICKLVLNRNIQMIMEVVWTKLEFPCIIRDVCETMGMGVYVATALCTQHSLHATKIIHKPNHGDTR